MERDVHGDHGGFEREGHSRGRRPNRRNATDIGTTYVHYLRDRRPPARVSRAFESERPVPSYISNILPPIARTDRPVDTIPAKHLHTAFNKMRHPVNVVKWTPEGRRLLTGSTSGEFTLWNGTGFNFETIMQAHDAAILAVEYAHNDEFLISADKEGLVKYWQTNFNNIQEVQAHQDTVRDLCFAPNDSKFATASDDASVKIFDFGTGQELSQMTGHTWDVRTVDWHPAKGLLASGSKDHQVKLWDPRTGRCLTSLMGHKNTVNMVSWGGRNGDLIASCARDSVRVFDTRMMRDVFLLKGNKKDVSALVWHPIHSSLLTTGSQEGEMKHYLLDEPNNGAHGAPSTLSPYDSKNPAEAPAQAIYPAHEVNHAHDTVIWSLDWHPMGHILASGSNDKATRFWTRPRPGENSYLKDKYHIGQEEAERQGTFSRKAMREEEEADAEDDEDAIEDQKQGSRLPGLPGLPGLASSSLPVPLPGFGQAQNAQNFPSQQAFLPPGNLPPPPGMDLSALFSGQGQFPSGLPPLPPGFPASLPGMAGMPPGFAPPAGFPSAGLPGMSGSPPASSSADSGGGGGGGGGGVRRRAPLPDQADALKAEMRQGRYTKAR